MMVASVGCPEQARYEPPQEVGQMQIQVPDECEHESAYNGLKHERLIRQQGTHEAEGEQYRD